MNFLNAKTVRLVEHFGDRVESHSVYTENYLEQVITVRMSARTRPELIELVVCFDKEQKLPKKLSISINQYTMNPFDIEINLIKNGKRKPYRTVKMDELRTIVEIAPDTMKLVFSINKEKNIGKSAQMKIGINHIAF